jgi:hypothetical protein
MMRSFWLYKTLLIASLCLVLLLAADAQECSNPEVCVSTDGKIDDQSSSKVVVEDPKCPSRGQIIRCAGTHLDLDKNGKLERAELQQAIDQLPWYVVLAFNASSLGRVLVGSSRVLYRLFLNSPAELSPLVSFLYTGLLEVC